MVRICICTHHCLKDKHSGALDRILNFAKSISNEGATVYLVDREIKRSNIILDGDKYYKVEKGFFKEKEYPLLIRLFFPWLVKYTQVFLSILLRLLLGSFETSTGFSSVEYFTYAIDPQLLVKLFFVCKKENIELIQSEFPTPIVSSFIVKKILGLPLIFDSHNIESVIVKRVTKTNKILTASLRKLEMICCHLSDVIFVVSDNDKEILSSWGVPTKNIVVIPNSIQLRIFSPKTNGRKIREKYQLNAVTLIFHGVLDYPPNREATTVLVNRIFPNIVKRYPSVRLLLVGNNPPLISHPNVIITGFVEDLPQYIAAADVAVVPLLAGGGTRIKILEYMACGKPVVSTKIGAEGLNLRDGIEILVTDRPNSEFVVLVNKLIEDKTLRQKLGENARKKVELSFDWKKTAKKAISSYEHLANQNRRIP